MPEFGETAGDFVHNLIQSLQKRLNEVAITHSPDGLTPGV